MPEFRKCIIALAGVALFAGLASAQVGTPSGGALGTAFTCGTTNGSVTPTLRAEGYTELTGDMVIVCSGGGSAGSRLRHPDRQLHDLPEHGCHQPVASDDDGRQRL